MSSIEIRALIDANVHRLSPLLCDQLRKIAASHERIAAELEAAAVQLAELRKDLEEA